MTATPRLFEPSEIIPAMSAAVPKLDCYVVIAFWRGGHWKIFPDQWISRDAAERAVEKLPVGYLYPHILRVEIDPRARETSA